VLTVYAFSSENWRRTPEEVEFLMSLFVEYCNSEKQLMKDIEVQFRVIGNMDSLDPRVAEVFNEVTRFTSGGKRMVLNVCINYGSRYEILLAVKKIARDAIAGKIDLDKLTDEDFSNCLYTADLPDPDLLIRTSGELRISNFLLWQNAYSEFWFTEKFWPDFRRLEFLKAIVDFQGRDRRFGGTTPKKSS
jgi:undecaprenyl diphosphate synthase